MVVQYLGNLMKQLLLPLQQQACIDSVDAGVERNHPTHQLNIPGFYAGKELIDQLDFVAATEQKIFEV